MNITQFVMAYGAEQDRLRALLPESFTSLRPVLRINAELRGGSVIARLAISRPVVIARLAIASRGNLL